MNIKPSTVNFDPSAPSYIYIKGPLLGKVSLNISEGVKKQINRSLNQLSRMYFFNLVVKIWGGDNKVDNWKGRIRSQLEEKETSSRRVKKDPNT